MSEAKTRFAEGEIFRMESDEFDSVVMAGCTVLGLKAAGTTMMLKTQKSFV